jgi:hypothetical protein
LIICETKNRYDFTATGKPDIMSPFSRPCIEQPKFTSDAQQVRIVTHMLLKVGDFHLCAFFSATAADATYRLDFLSTCALIAETRFPASTGGE